MNKLFNYRFYCLINNSIKRTKLNSNSLKTMIVDNCGPICGHNKRLINTIEKIGKNVKNKSFERLSNNNEINDNFENNYKSRAQMKDESNEVLKTLDANEMAFNITVTEMKRFLQNNKIKVTDGRTCLSIDCPFCSSRPKPLNSMNKSFDSKLYINKKTSNFICYSCETSGVWISFVELISSLKSKKSNKKDLILPKVNTDLFGDENTKNLLNQIMENSLTIDDLTEEQLKEVKNKFNLNCFTKSSLKYFDVCVSKDLKQLIFPFKSCYNKNSINALKIIELNEEKQGIDSKKFVERVVPNDTKLSVFGLNQHFLKNCSFDELVITDSPLDAIAVTQQTNIPSVSMPLNGRAANIRPEVLPFFEKFKKVNIYPLFQSFIDLL